LILSNSNEDFSVKRINMTNENEIEKKIISSGAIDYLADKLKQHNHLKGIKLERTQPNGTRESLSI